MSLLHPSPPPWPTYATTTIGHQLEGISHKIDLVSSGYALFYSIQSIVGWLWRPSLNTLCYRKESFFFLAKFTLSPQQQLDKCNQAWFNPTTVGGKWSKRQWNQSGTNEPEKSHSPDKSRNFQDILWKKVQKLKKDCNSFFYFTIYLLLFKSRPDWLRDWIWICRSF